MLNKPFIYEKKISHHTREPAPRHGTEPLAYPRLRAVGALPSYCIRRASARRGHGAALAPAPCAAAAGPAAGGLRRLRRLRGRSGRVRGRLQAVRPELAPGARQTQIREVEAGRFRDPHGRLPHFREVSVQCCFLQVPRRGGARRGPALLHRRRRGGEVRGASVRQRLGDTVGESQFLRIFSTNVQFEKRALAKANIFEESRSAVTNTSGELGCILEAQLRSVFLTRRYAW